MRALFSKWQFWALVVFVIFDVVTFAVPFGSLGLLVSTFVRPLRLWIVDFLLDFEDDKYATLNECYGAEDQPKS